MHQARLGDTPDLRVACAARDGDVAAQAELLRRRYRMVRGLVRRRLGTDADSDDITQDCLVSLLLSFSSLEDPKAEVAWTQAVVLRTLAKRLRDRSVMRRSIRRFSRDWADQQRQAKTSPPDHSTELARLLAGTHREPYLALAYQTLVGTSLPEVAALSGTSLSTLQRRIRSARAAVVP